VFDTVPHRRLRATPPGQRAIGPCRSQLTACTPGLAPAPKLGNEYGKPLPFFTPNGTKQQPLQLSAGTEPRLPECVYCPNNHVRASNDERYLHGNQNAYQYV